MLKAKMRFMGKTTKPFSNFLPAIKKAPHLADEGLLN